MLAIAQYFIREPDRFYRASIHIAHAMQIRAKEREKKNKANSRGQTPMIAQILKNARVG